MLPHKPKLHYSNVISFMYNNNLVSFGDISVVVNACGEVGHVYMILIY